MRALVRLAGHALGLASLCVAAPAHGRCGDQAGDAAAIAEARVAVEAACACAGAATHGAYVRCATGVARARVAAGLLARSCRRAVTSCAARSTCGKAGAVTCCVGGRSRTRCRVVRNAGRCAALGGCVRSQPSCCDACVAGCMPCPPNDGGGPDLLTLTVLEAGTDLDLGWTGVNHNQPVPAGWQLGLCLSACDGTTDSTCTAVGPTGTASLNSAVLGTPFPLMAGGVPMCIVHRFSDAVRGTADVATGEIALTANVMADVYVTDARLPCPPCVDGVCERGSYGSVPRGRCTVQATVEVTESLRPDKTFPLSRDCLPAGEPVGTVALALPLTTGSSGPPGTMGSRPCREREAEGVPVRDDACGGSGCGAPCLPGSPACTTMAPDPTDPGGAAVCVGSKGGISQVCCRDDRKIPCFPTADGTLVRTGRAVPPTPAWPSPDYPKDATGVVLAATQCHAATTAFGVDQVSGLPGPLALLLSTRAVWQKP